MFCDPDSDCDNNLSSMCSSEKHVIVLVLLTQTQANCDHVIVLFPQ